jgi:hypothetical protein
MLFGILILRVGVTAVLGLMLLGILLLIPYCVLTLPFSGLAVLICHGVRTLPDAQRRRLRVAAITLLCTPMILPGGMWVIALPSGLVLPALLINRWQVVSDYALGHRKDLPHLVAYLEVWAPAFALVAFLSNLILRRRGDRKNRDRVREV